MIDFENGALWKLRKCDESAIGKNLRLLLIEGEQIIGAYKSVRDFVVFTDRRVIACNVQGITGKSKTIHRCPIKRFPSFQSRLLERSISTVNLKCILAEWEKSSLSF